MVAMRQCEYWPRKTRRRSPRCGLTLRSPTQQNRSSRACAATRLPSATLADGAKSPSRPSALSRPSCSATLYRNPDRVAPSTHRRRAPAHAQDVRVFSVHSTLSSGALGCLAATRVDQATHARPRARVDGFARAQRHAVAARAVVRLQLAVGTSRTRTGLRRFADPAVVTFGRAAATVRSRRVARICMTRRRRVGATRHLRTSVDRSTAVNARAGVHTSAPVRPRTPVDGRGRRRILRVPTAAIGPH